MPKLRIVDGGGVEQTIDVRDRRLQIGRGRDNDVVLPDSEKGVSRTHAELRFENGRYVIVDLQSQNGTWLNGRRVERAEVPLGAEIAVGAYRLSLLDDAPSRIAGGPPVFRADPLDDMRATELHQSPRFPPPVPAVASPSLPRWVPAAGVIAAAVIVVLAMVAWFSGRGPGTAPVGADGPSAPGTVAAPADPAALPSPGMPERPDASTERAFEMPVVPRPAPAQVVTETQGPADNRNPGAPAIGRRPGESSEAWRSRSAALQMRYGYSRAALDRGDFAAAAGGFEAILLEEPGFLDAPRLLVQAQSGLRASARSLFQAGTSLDAAGDWVGALRKLEQARQIHADIPGLSERIAAVRRKLRAAGNRAFDQARQLEAEGRVQEALKEYDKAIQWLPVDDPNRQTARARVEQIRKND